MMLLIIVIALICAFVGYKVYKSIELDEIMEMRRQAGLDNKVNNYDKR